MVFRMHNFTIMPTFQSRDSLPDPTEWLAIDTVLYVAAVLLIIAILLVVSKIMCRTCSRKLKQYVLNRIRMNRFIRKFCILDSSVTRKQSIVF